MYGIIAQLGEHLPYKQGVTGSSPVGPTKLQSCMVEFPSGQRGQTVNLLATLSVVRIHSPPPNLTLYDDKTNVYQFLTCGCSSVVEPRPSKPVARVRSPSPAPDDPLAQSAEHLTFNQGVPRSSRGWVTILYFYNYIFLERCPSGLRSWS